MLGRLLKYNRMKQQKKQSDVCDNICSVSYYSKIENGKIEPPDDLIDQLMLSLNITRNDLQFQDDNKLKQEILSWHILIMNGSQKDAERMKPTLQDELTFNQNNNLHILFEIICIRFFYLKKDEKKAQSILTRIESSIDKKTPIEILFYFDKIKAIAYDYNEKYLDAKNKAIKAKNHITSLTLPQEELVDLFYLIGLFATKNRDVMISIHFLRKALNIYDRNYDYWKSGTCRILLSDSYKEIEQNEEAEQQLLLANKIAQQLKDPKLEADVLQHYGNLSVKNGKLMEAIHDYQMSYRLRQGASRLSTIDSMLLCFKELGQAQDILSWLEHGFETLNTISNSRELSPYEKKYFMKFLYYRVAFDHEYMSEFENTLIEIILPFFEGKKEHSSISFYCEELARFYELNENYLLANKFLKRANKAIRC